MKFLLHVLLNNAVYCQVYKASMTEWISMVHCSNDTDKIKANYLKDTHPHATSFTKTLYQNEILPGPTWWEAGN